MTIKDHGKVSPSIKDFTPPRDNLPVHQVMVNRELLVATNHHPNKPVTPRDDTPKIDAKDHCLGLDILLTNQETGNNIKVTGISLTNSAVIKRKFWVR